jgi:hypothetical protein
LAHKEIDNNQDLSKKKYGQWLNSKRTYKKKIKIKNDINNIHLPRTRKPLLIGKNVNSNIKGIEKKLHFYTSR